MSDVGVISYEYERTSKTADKINDALMTVKRKYYALASSPTLLEDKISESSKYLSCVLRTVISIFSRRVDVDAIDPLFEADLSDALLQRIRANLTSEAIHHIAKLRETSAHLDQGVDSLTDSDLRVLDALFDAVDIQTTITFRQFSRD